MMYRRTVVLAAVLCTSVVAATCGGDDGTTGESTLQRGNGHPTSPMVILSSGDLPSDPRLGVGLYPAYPDLDGLSSLLEEWEDSGVQRVDISYSDIEYPIDWSYSETQIDPAFDRLIDDLHRRGIAVDYMVHFWDKEGYAAGEVLETPRFRTDEQVEDYLGYLRSIVQRYRGRIEYYTIWSEPDACGGGGIKCIEPADYVALAERAIDVVRDIDPTAKVALAPVVLYHARDYLTALLQSTVIDEFDVIQWHGVYNVVPGDTPVGRYYDDYPAIVEEIKRTAVARGFTGEFWGTEITYCVTAFDAGCPAADPPLSDVQAATYYARALLVHLWLDVGTSSKTYRDTSGPVTFATIGRLHTLLAGTSPARTEVEVDTDATDVVSGAFETDDGDLLFALWVDHAVGGQEPDRRASVTFPGMAGTSAIGYDVVDGVEQQLVTTNDGGDLVVADLSIGAAPVLLRLDA